MNDTNIIPGIRSAGQFEAVTPFDKVVNPEVYYTTEAIRTIPEMQGLNIDLYTMVLQPAGIPKDDTTAKINEMLTSNAVIVTLTSNGNPPVYVPSSYLSSFPAIDGVVYEHMCIVVDLGAVPPGMSDKITNQLTEIQQYVANNIGVDNKVQVGVIPTKGYVSKQQAENFEKSRLLKIQNGGNLVIENEALKKANQEQAAYILELEAAVKTKK